MGTTRCSRSWEERAVLPTRDTRFGSGSNEHGRWWFRFDRGLTGRCETMLYLYFRFNSGFLLLTCCGWPGNVHMGEVERYRRGLSPLSNELTRVVNDDRDDGLRGRAAGG